MCKYGENIYYSKNIKIPANEPVKAWYLEISNYDFKDPCFNPLTGHFTQIVWRSSKQLGIGVSIK